MDMTTVSCRDFVSALASPAPTPGGGGAAALLGAIGTALGNMVGALTVGKKKYAAVEEELRALTARCDALQAALLRQVEADEKGFLPLAEAYRLPKDDPTRESTLEEASVAACKVPLRIMALCCEALDAVAALAEIGSRLALSDAGCGAAALKAALQAASLNVLINTKGLKDRSRADALNEVCLSMLEAGGAQADRIFTQVKNGLTT
ncbi:MAG: cyclodeaminase/cyclohydrolase family protein [Oscillospiraceae bacterium]|nr:cyclodeaminase/cyclohydrolase family protein [Oscillospiraceae bacterium]